MSKDLSAASRVHPRQQAVLDAKDAKARLAATGYSMGDTVQTPDGEGVVEVCCINKETGKNELNGRYYWIKVGDETRRFDASDLPEPSTGEEG